MRRPATNLLRRAPAALLGALLTLGPAAAVAAEPVGPRPRIDASVYPWQVFGQLNRQGRGTCTAVLVAPDLVLTAAHCLYDSKLGAWAAPARLHFVAGFQIREIAFHAPARSFEVAPGYVPGGLEGTAERAARDWALVRLEKPAPASLGYLGVARLDRRARLPSAAAFDLAGYGRDRPHALSADHGCSLVAWEANTPLVLHDCRAARGTSGAPIVRAEGAAYLVYAVHVGRTEVLERDGRLGVAVPAASFFEAVRAATGRKIERSPDGFDFIPGRPAE